MALSLRRDQVERCTRKTKKIDVEELREEVKREGMDGISTRFIMKALDNALSDNIEHNCIHPLNVREALIAMVKNGDFYYLFASETNHWRSSRTFYRKARSIKELANAPEEEIIVYPEATNNILSHGSQHRMIFEVEPGKWLFSGNRYPDESPSDWDLRFGRAVQAPVRFTPDKNGTHIRSTSLAYYFQPVRRC